MYEYAQNTYSFQSATVAQAGQVSDLSISTIDSFAAEQTIEFGVALMRGTDTQNQVKNWSGDIDTKFLGVSVFTYLNAPTLANLGNSNKYLLTDSVRVLTRGRIWVAAAVDVTAGEPAYIKVAVDETAGTFTNVSADNLLVGTFLTSATADNLVELEIR